MLREHGFEQGHFALAQDPDHDLRRDLPGFRQPPGEFRSLVHDDSGLRFVGHDFRNRGVEGFVQLLGVDIELFRHVYFKGRGHPPIHALGQFPVEIGPAQYGVLVAVDAFRLFHKIFHGGLRYACVAVFQQRLDHVLIAAFHQRVGYALAEGAVHGDGKLVLQGAVANDLDEVGIVEQFALDQDRVGDLEFVIGQGDDQIMGDVVQGRQLVGEFVANRHLRGMQEATQNPGHQGPFKVGQDIVALGEKISHGVGEQRPAGGGFVPRHFQQCLVIVSVAAVGHRSPRG